MPAVLRVQCAARWWITQLLEAAGVHPGGLRWLIERWGLSHYAAGAPHANKDEHVVVLSHSARLCIALERGGCTGMSVHKAALTGRQRC